MSSSRADAANHGQMRAFTGNWGKRKGVLGAMLRGDQAKVNHPRRKPAQLVEEKGIL
jgi:hypothetical protein